MITSHQRQMIGHERLAHERIDLHRHSSVFRRGLDVCCETITMCSLHFKATERVACTHK
jgi:hypothetical protein